jgi:hypothetical protein
VKPSIEVPHLKAEVVCAQSSWAVHGMTHTNPAFLAAHKKFFVKQKSLRYSHLLCIGSRRPRERSLATEVSLDDDLYRNYDVAANDDALLKGYMTVATLLAMSLLCFNVNAYQLPNHHG